MRFIEYRGEGYRYRYVTKEIESTHNTIEYGIYSP